MKLTTIWTIRAIPFKERLSRTRELFWMQAAWHAPRSLRYWVFATARIPHNVNVPDVRLTDAMKYERPSS